MAARLQRVMAVLQQLTCTSWILLGLSVGVLAAEPA
jgi:hypothetical protein